MSLVLFQYSQFKYANSKYLQLKFSQLKKFNQEQERWKQVLNILCWLSNQQTIRKMHLERFRQRLMQIRKLILRRRWLRKKRLYHHWLHQIIYLLEEIKKKKALFLEDIKKCEEIKKKTLLLENTRKKEISQNISCKCNL